MKIKIFTLLLSLFMILGISAQSRYFYYYQGKKYFLQADKSSIAISTRTADASKTLKTKTPVVENFTRNSLVAADRKSLENNRTFYAEIESDAATDEKYAADIAEKNANPEVLIASPCFISAEGQKMGMSNNFYVKLKSKNDVGLLRELAAKNKVTVLGYNEYMPLWYTVEVTKNSVRASAMDMANLFFETGKFEIAEPEFMYHNLEATADPYFPNQWSLKNTGQYGAAYAGIDIKAEQAWTLSTGANVKTAIFDHGFEMNHPDLAANVFGTGYDAQTNTSPSVVRGDHGTACAGITGAVQNNNLGVSGVAPNTRLISISINLTFADTPQQLANGFNWATTNGVDVISNSWGGYAPSAIIENGITNALVNGRAGKGMVVVFAAGNENNTNIRYPGGWDPRILVVGALSPCGERKSPTSCDGEGWGSCYGTQLDIMAPGVKMATTDRQGSNGYDSSNYTQTFNGTSSACPVIAGVAALILSANPCLTGQQVRDIIEQTAQKVRTDLYAYASASGRANGTWHTQMGYGLVNAYAAVQRAKSMSGLAALDSAADIGLEPNPSANTWANIYQSPDIWNRLTNDNLNITHENPGYAGPGHNVMRFRVRNLGCATSAPSFAKLYWTMGSTGETWPESWNGTRLINGYSAGGELTIPYTGFNPSNSYATAQGFKIPPIAPGQEYIIDAKWTPVDPAIYGGHSDNVICFLGRITSANDPMFNENPGPNAPLEPNVVNNNNIVTRNARLVNLSGTFSKFSGFYFGNYFGYAMPFDIRLQLVKDSNTPFKSIGRTVIKLSDVIWDRWKESGMQGSGIDILNYNTHEVLVVDPSNVILRNIRLEADEYYPVTLSFSVANNGNGAPENYDFAATQIISDKPDEIYGTACHFLVSINQKDSNGTPYCDEKCRQAQAQSMIVQDLKLSPNPASNVATLEMNLLQDARMSIQIMDYNGKTLKTISNGEGMRKGINKKSFSISELIDGVYVVSILANNEKRSVHLIVKH